MAQWEKRIAAVENLEVGKPYTKSAVADALGVPPPKNSRDWGGLVSFANAELLFITLEKDPARYAAEHRYDDRFAGGVLYWDSRASHDKKSAHVLRVRRSSLVLGFARTREKASGRTLPFHFVGQLVFDDWWGQRPVRFTWRLKEYPEGLRGTPELEAIASWRPPNAVVGGPQARVNVSDGPVGSRGARAPTTRTGTEGARTQVLANRYERDPRARRECLDHHGTACDVCEFDFEAMYGDIGAGFVFVHHRVPVAFRARDGAYELDPIRDLIPLCGNCHAVVHRRGSADESMPGLTPEQTARLLELRTLASANEWEATE